MPRSIASLLDEYLSACPPFNWQRQHHCAAFAAGWVQQVEGQAPRLPSVAGQLQARRALRSLGLDLASAVSQALQRQPVPPAHARPGDLVLLAASPQQGGATRAQQALAICAGRTLAGIGPAGVVHAPLQHALLAWHVGPQPC